MMRFFRPTCLLVEAAVIVAAPLATLAFAGSASAVSVSPDAAVTCTKLKGSTSTNSANLSGCSASTGGHGVILNFVPTGGSVTWADGSMTDYMSNYTNPSTGCPVGALAYTIVGSVTSSTNPGIPSGAPVKMKICDLSTGVLKNETGTLVKF